ncbi:MAG: hypothetical protein EP332_02265 [Bacteroidetes bacterium]|nr:MAG: hypothetical protein EP332_02265 [Bacteroidota bacterium]
MLLDFFSIVHPAFLSFSASQTSLPLFLLTAFEDEPELNSPADARISLLEENENLQLFLIIAGLLFLILLFLVAVYYQKYKKTLRLYESKRVEYHRLMIGSTEPSAELVRLQEALNSERAKVVKHEVQKKELLAYIEELKASQASTEIRHKTIQISRILADQKTEDIAKKVEKTAKILYPELVAEVQERYPQLNQIEMQYCMMLALDYNLDEIISILGRSEKAIKSLRYRIRKKMELDEQKSLPDFIQELKQYITHIQ